MRLNEPQAASGFTKFRLLMWKNLLQQWRHRIQTLIEVLLPIATLSIILILRWQIQPSMKDGYNFPPVPVHTLEHSSLVIGGMDWDNFTSITVAYSPRNSLLEDVIRSAFVNLIVLNAIDIWHSSNISDLIPPDIIPPDIGGDLDLTLIEEFAKTLLRIDAYTSSEDLVTIYAQEDNIRTVLAAVEFDDSLRDISTLSNVKDLSYALRFPERPRLYSLFFQGSQSWRTDVSFPTFEMPGPRYPYSIVGGNDPGYVNELFIAMQHVISMELISRVTGESLQRFRIWFQRYPHPPYLEDLAVETMQFIFPMFVMLSFSYTAVNITRAIAAEKENQLKETMKIMGLPTWLHWLAWFFKQFIFLFVISIVIVIILKTKWFTNDDGFGDYSLFTNTPWTVLIFFLNIYFCCMIFFCFMTSGFFSKASRASLFMGIIWFLTYIPAFILLIDVQMSTAVQVFTCLSINSAMAYGFQLLLVKESSGGLQWGEFMTSMEADSTRFVFGHVIIMLVLDCVLYMLIALYLEQIFPGELGSPKRWYFPIQKQFWCPTRTSDDSSLVEYDDDVKRENEPIGHTVGVKITNLTKVYNNNKVVNSLNLNIYDDQITVLLGHNGAGKSTTISMITGNVAMSSGSVKVGQYDVSKELSAARSQLGLCPQHNVLFDDLTVREHIEFFARLKGFSGKDLSDEIDMLVEKLELQEKREVRAAALSGGQKRRLCVGIALSGGARVVLLDEPTSGMDPAARRGLWELLQKEKKGRSMILTTHFMDEADILGDRVAIMAHGRLQCIGSPFFLKRLYGVGYTLVVVKDEQFCQETCTQLIGQFIPNVGIQEDRGTEITYSLTNEYSHVFESLFIELEKNTHKIHYKDYGLVATTLEDVFLSVGSDRVQPNSIDSDCGTESSTDIVSVDKEMDASSQEKLASEDKLVGVGLWWQQVKATFTKLFLVASRSWILLLLQVLVPIININASLGILQWVMSLTDSIVRRPLTIAQGYTETDTLLSYNGSVAGTIGYIATEAYRNMFNESIVPPSMRLTLVDGLQPVDQYFLERPDAWSKRLLIGATFDSSSAVAWFSNEGHHDVSNSLSALHSSLLRAFVPDAELTVYNHPLPVNYKNNNNMAMLVSMLSMQTSQGIGNSLVIVSAVFVMFYIRERTSGAKLLQRCAGLQPAVMWFTAAIFDWLWFLILCLSIALACLYFDVAGLNSFSDLARLYLCFGVYGAAMLPFVYLLSHVLKGPAIGFVIVFFINTIFGLIGAQVVQALATPGLDTETVANVMDAVLQFFPLYSVVTAIRDLNQLGLMHHTCLTSCEQLATMLDIQECSIDVMCEQLPDTCCVSLDGHLRWESPGVLRYLICTLASGVVLWAVLMIVEYRLLHSLFRCERKPPPLEEENLDEDVVQEIRQVEQIEKRSLREHSLVVSALSKYYGKHLAVDQISFRVDDTECFGLLGVNGAGKTTTFKMLIGELLISSGNAYVNGYPIKKKLTKAYENMGYCPQFDAIFPELTGRENLQLFAALHGLRPGIAHKRIAELADALTFTTHLDKRLKQYSGGNRRKASTAVALVGGTRLLLADEPTTGVDAAARRAVWRTMRSATSAGAGLLLTSHSMDECEALCSRLTIMVNGRPYCLGSPQHLKNKFSQGNTLTIKLKIDEDPTSLSSSLERVKDYINTTFTNPKLMEQYQGLVTYYLPERNMPWSAMFGTMERAKEHLPVEDYTISQTSLEQIFLHFTKFQN